MISAGKCIRRWTAFLASPHAVEQRDHYTGTIGAALARTDAMAINRAQKFSLANGKKTVFQKRRSIICITTNKTSDTRRIKQREIHLLQARNTFIDLTLAAERAEDFFHCRTSNAHVGLKPQKTRSTPRRDSEVKTPGNREAGLPFLLSFAKYIRSRVIHPSAAAGKQSPYCVQTVAMHSFPLPTRVLFSGDSSVA